MKTRLKQTTKEKLMLRGNVNTVYHDSTPDVCCFCSFVFLITCHIQKEMVSLAEVDNLFSSFHLSVTEGMRKGGRGIKSVCVTFDVHGAVSVEGCAGLELIITTEDSREEM